ncbi:pilus assembly protein [Rhodovarius crocodyli]|uniref:Pilus assembly protein n=1 Tax=Rhodovarius crocodyli TaxID=1979269 RepID=A0A437M1W8_9PROT|nr:TadE/TadG family type IV pilus assembly protein [Rhodovarius crocodyli]RVT91543.1 pilus assembly protein [Rhodovarius crocodyli]
MRGVRQRLAWARRGSVSIEFAILATLMLMLIFAIISFGVQFGARLVATQAASEGARASVAGLTAAERTSLANTAVTNLLTRYGGLASTRQVVVTPIGNPVTRVDVTVTLDISRFGLQRLATLVPAMTNRPSATVSVQVGGYY